MEKQHLTNIDHGMNLYADWTIIAHDLDGNEVYREEKTNLILRAARKDVLRFLFNVGSPVTTGYLYLGVGSGSAAAAVTQTALVAELVGNANRLSVTDTSGGSVDDTDITQSTSGGFDQLITVQAVYPTGDGNNGSNFREYGLFSSATFAMGQLLNRFVSASDIAKSSSLAITVQVNLRT